MTQHALRAPEKQQRRKYLTFKTRIGKELPDFVVEQVDPDPGKAIEGAVQVVDPLTVKLMLPRADISLMAGIAGCPAATVPASYAHETMVNNSVGTGPYTIERLEAGIKGVLVRNANHSWWNESNGAFIDRIEYIDFGTKPCAESRKELVALGEKFIQDEGVTPRPY